MGVPALFRWLSRKYPKIISPVLEEETRMVNGVSIPPDYSNPNPNGELDNLYLDMNGIVHPCSHPEDKPPPETEDEMLLAVFEYTDRVVNMARPRKILMIAVDGVAPRAKMNQQRARRFRSAKDAQIQDEERAKLTQDYGATIDESVKSKKTWDSNAITPGTPFMDKLALALRYWTAYKLATDPGWANVQIIISDATVPGEGEHKIMNFIRSQRSDIEYNPNTRHAIYGLDADLIFLGLATHEPHFRVLREDVFARDNRSMGLKDQINMTEEEKAILKEQDSKKPFLWLNINVLREYLEVELNIPRLSFKFDLERAIDDWVFMCFFCGNDFLPHLPSLDVRDNSIDTLVRIWKQVLPRMKTYITCDGTLNLENVEILLSQLATREPDIFAKRIADEQRRSDQNNRKKMFREQDKIARQQYMANNVTKGKADKGTFNPVSNIPLFDVNNNTVNDLNLTNSDLVQMRTQVNLAAFGDKSAMAALQEKSIEKNGEFKQEEVKIEVIESANKANISAAAALREQLLANKAKDDRSASETPSVGEKRRFEESGNSSSLDDDVDGDPVRLGEPGYIDRYYQTKFHVQKDEVDPLRKTVVEHYIEGISWVLLYYYQGCPSWNWYYPYHYAPFASDFTGIKDLQIKFNQGEPFLPFEQLMSVLPAASGHTLPPIFRPLMSEPDSPIIDFYPEDFPIDMNGKKMSWQGIVLLPFIDEKRLLQIVREQYPKLTDYEKSRNIRKEEVVFISNKNPNYERFKKLYKPKNIEIKKQLSFHFGKSGLAGAVTANSKFKFESVLECPILGDHIYNNIPTDLFLKLDYNMPPKTWGKSIILTGYIKHNPILTHEDKDSIIYGGGRGRRNFNPDSQNIIQVGPGSNSVYSNRVGGYKSFLLLASQQLNQVQQQQHLKNIVNRAQGHHQHQHNSGARNNGPRNNGYLPKPSGGGVLR
jgi:5'-3' exoribonuclease 2